MTPTPAKNVLSPGPLLPVVGLVGSVVGLCFPPLLLISLGLGVYSLLRANKDPAWAVRKQIAQMTIAVSAAGLLVTSAVIIPGVKRRQLYLRQLECHAALDVLYQAQARLYAKEKRYTTRPSELDTPTPHGRFILRLAAEGELSEVGQWLEAPAPDATTSKGLDEAVPKLIVREVGVRGDCPACSITMLCAANLDEDSTLDVWTVSSVERTDGSGNKIPGGVAWNELDDVAR